MWRPPDPPQFRALPAAFGVSRHTECWIGMRYFGRQPTMLKLVWMSLTVSPLLAEVPERNPHLAGFVSQIVLDTGARKYNQTYW